MLSAPEAFMAVANATAAIVQKAPPYVSYRVRGTVHFFKGDGEIDRTVTVRTSDGNAVIHDESSGKDVLAPPFPAPPNFDALSSFDLRGTFSATSGTKRRGLARDVDLRVVNVEPLRYTTVASRADAVSRSVRGYVITYAGEPGAAGVHLHFEPVASYYRDHTKWLHDVWYDPATMIPSRIVWAGNDHLELDAHYADVRGVWLLQSIDVARVFYPILGRIAAGFHGDYADYQFSNVAPDPRLAPSPSPAAAATPAPASSP
jgi:hypothetical protein